ncbi:hypothetical protein ACFY12_07810 [Streptomyces sp. NPDC001339]|uniref:hypothetical protein n=1 Tax=unclassified Streptomyces TaxID=2593676 RepID=UPI000856CE20|nr:hypothetical protein [Streptomyces sp. NBRC 110611]GAU71082.1 UmuC protein [Streptomyces sp. NBRC 110611]
MTINKSRGSAMEPPASRKGIIPSPERGETRSFDRWEVHLCSSLLVVVFVVVLIVVALPDLWPFIVGVPAIWPLGARVIALLLASCRRSGVRYVRVRTA